MREGIAELRTRILPDGKPSFERERSHTMAEQADRPVNESVTTTSKKDNGVRETWVQEHGGLIFVAIVFLVVSFVALYEFFMN